MKSTTYFILGLTFLSGCTLAPTPQGGAPVVNRNPVPRFDPNPLASRTPPQRQQPVQPRPQPSRPPAVATRPPSPPQDITEAIPLAPLPPLEPRSRVDAAVVPRFEGPSTPDPFGAPLAGQPDPFGAPLAGQPDPFETPIATAPSPRMTIPQPPTTPPDPFETPIATAPPPPRMAVPQPPTTDNVSLSRDDASPALNALLDEAEQAIGNNQLDRAAAALERAMRIEPRNASLWHDLGQIRLVQRRYDEAELLATKSNTLAGGNTALQERNWRMIAQARRASGDEMGARDAERQAAF